MTKPRKVDRIVSTDTPGDLDRFHGKLLLGGLLTGLMADYQARSGGQSLILDANPVFDQDGEFSNRVSVTMRSGNYQIIIVDEGRVIEEEEEL